MATNMDKSLYSAPLGLDSIVPDALDKGEPALEIEIENPDRVTLADGSVEITLLPDGEDEESFGANLAEFMDESDLASMASELVGLVDADIAARKDWVDAYVKGLEVLGMKYDERTEPWAGACGVYSTVLTEAAIRFQAEMITETFPAQGPVKTQIVGAIDKLKEEAATRVQDDMNYQILEKMPEYRPDHEKLLFSLGLAGSAFKKVYKDPSLGRQAAVFIPSEEIIIPYGASDVQSAERATHVMRKTPNEIRKLQVAKFYRDVELGDPVQISTDVEKKKAEDQGYTLTDDDRFQLLEIHVDYDLPGYEDKDGIALPYVITIERGTNEVLAVRRNWDEDNAKRLKNQYFVQYTYIPGFGPYGLGLINLIGGYARAGTSLIRQLIDAGSLANLPGGLKSKGLRIKGDDTPIAPGEFRDVDVASGTVRDNIMPLPYKEPSQTLLALLNQVTDEARRLGAISDMKISDMSANAPVGTTLALLERTLKTMSAVQARVHASMKQEFKLLATIIRDSAPEEYEFDPAQGDRRAKRADYSMVEVIPVSDPNSSTMAQRIMQYQAAIQLAQGAPQIYDLPQLHRQMLEVLGIKNAEKLVPVEDDMKPRDPVSENMAFLTGKPTKAFLVQDHEAHIAVHTSMMQDPVMMAQIGQSPQAAAMQAAIMSHVSEHLAFVYRKKIEDQLGGALPPPDEDLPADVEVGLSQLVAQAAKQVLGQSQQQAAQQQAQQQAQDPMVQMQQQELQIKQQELQLKQQAAQIKQMESQAKLTLDTQKMQGDFAARADELKLKEKQVAIDAATKADAHELQKVQAMLQSNKGSK
tara:strand:- start:2582 stop:5017 length:2436 start_codon:yes stop_codon:yes gene_type:complete